MNRKFAFRKNNFSAKIAILRVEAPKTYTYLKFSISRYLVMWWYYYLALFSIEYRAQCRWNGGNWCCNAFVMLVLVTIQWLFLRLNYFHKMQISCSLFFFTLCIITTRSIHMHSTINQNFPSYVNLNVHEKSRVQYSILITIAKCPTYITKIIFLSEFDYLWELKKSNCAVNNILIM